MLCPLVCRTRHQSRLRDQDAIIVFLTVCDRSLLPNVFYNNRSHSSPARLLTTDSYCIPTGRNAGCTCMCPAHLSRGRNVLCASLSIVSWVNCLCVHLNCHSFGELILIIASCCYSFILMLHSFGIHQPP